MLWTRRRQVDHRTSEPTCYVHIGTHKTGTTSIQHILTANEDRFATFGILIPRAGRAERAGGHHNLAWELNGDSRFDPDCGTFADVLREIERTGSNRVCLSSEDFEYLDAAALQTLADGLRAVGYRPVIIVYLRPQSGYIESLYVELVKHGLTESFDRYLADIITAGEVRFNERWRFQFDYEELVRDLTAVFGAAHILARRYDPEPPYGVVGDFLRLLGVRPGDIDRRTLRRSSRLNQSRPFAEVLAMRAENALVRAGQSARIELTDMRRRRGRFDPIHLPETRRIIERFGPGNRHVYERFGILVPCISGADLISDVAAALGFDPAARQRKRFMPVRANEPAAAASAPGARVGAALEGVLALAATAAAVCSIRFGGQIESTALVEYGLLSATFALSTLATGALCVLEAAGVFDDHRFFFRWCSRVRATGYSIVAVYAGANAFFDVRVPRFTPDWLSYPGLTAAVATAIVAGVMFLKHRRSSARALAASALRIRDDRFYPFAVRSRCSIWVCTRSAMRSISSSTVRRRSSAGN